jgi:hypothetical protein
MLPVAMRVQRCGWFNDVIFAAAAAPSRSDTRRPDILWRHTSGTVAMWLMNGAAITSAAAVANVPTNWVASHTA